MAKLKTGLALLAATAAVVSSCAKAPGLTPGQLTAGGGLSPSS